MKKMWFFIVLVILTGAGCKSAEETGGNIHLQEGRFDRAIEQYKEAAKKYPNGTRPLIGIATAYYMKKDFKEAAVYLEKAIKMDKKAVEEDIKGYENLLNTQYLKWQMYYNGAVENFNENPQRGVELAEKSLDVPNPEKVSLSYDLLARMMLNQEKIEDAKKYYNEAIKANKNSIESYINLGRILLTERKADEALKCFDDARKIDSTQVEVYELIGQAYLLNKDYTSATKLLERALSIVGKSPTILYNLMVAYYDRKNYDQAITNGKEVLALSDVKPEVLTNTYNLLGQIYQNKNDYKSAIAVMKESIDKGVNDCNSFYIIAHSYYKLGQAKESGIWAKKAQECEKSSDIKYEVTGSTSMADVTYRNKDGGTSQANGVSIPWSYSFKGSSGKLVYISAQSKRESGSITVTIYKDGSVFKSSKSSGAYCIAEASGTLP
jgi:tetratricopeptide (TPR) repeat protein